MKKFIIIFFIFCLIIFPKKIFSQCSKSSSGAASPLAVEHCETSFDVLKYTAKLDFTKAPKADMIGSCEIKFVWIKKPDAFIFHLADLIISDSYWLLQGNKIPASPIKSGMEYEALADSSFNMGDTVSLVINYSGKMTSEPGTNSWGGVFSSGTILYALGVGFSANYVSTTRHWLPCFDHPQDKALCDLTFKVSNKLNVASVGSLINQTSDSLTTTYQWVSRDVMATYLMTFAVDNFVPLNMKITDDLPPYVVYAKPTDTAATKVSFKKLPQMVDMYNRTFCPYPFEKVGYVNTPTGSMEHQTMISFASSISRSRDTINETAAHELAHQWFGDYVTCADFRHAWLNESFATFCETLWREELSGWQGYLNAQEKRLSTYVNSTSKQEQLLPLEDFPRATPSSNYPYTIYVKGAVVLGMLRYELGDSFFFGGIKSYLKKYAYSVATTQDLQKTLEEFSVKNLDLFFKQWVKGKGFPIIDVNVNGNEEDKYVVKIEQLQHDSVGLFTNVPVEITAELENGEKQEMLFKLDEKMQFFPFETSSKVKKISVNKGQRLRTLLEVRSVTTTSVNETIKLFTDSTKVQITAKPNPARASAGAILVDINNLNDCTEIEYQLYDTSGKKLITGKSDRCNFSLDIKNLLSGGYILNIKTKQGLYDVPIVVAR